MHQRTIINLLKHESLKANKQPWSNLTFNNRFRAVCVCVCVCVYLAGLVGLDVRSSDHERNSDVELVELPLIQRERELTWEEARDSF